jgi:hypothetical protein
MLKDATVREDAVRDTLDASASEEEIEYGIVACPTREYTPGAPVKA